jgi:hypothetical protein
MSSSSRASCWRHWGAASSVPPPAAVGSREASPGGSTGIHRLELAAGCPKAFTRSTQRKYKRRERVSSLARVAVAGSSDSHRLLPGCHELRQVQRSAALRSLREAWDSCREPAQRPDWRGGEAAANRRQGIDGVHRLELAAGCPKTFARSTQRKYKRRERGCSLARVAGGRFMRQPQTSTWLSRTTPGPTACCSAPSARSVGQLPRTGSAADWRGGELHGPAVLVFSLMFLVSFVALVARRQHVQRDSERRSTQRRASKQISRSLSAAVA